MKDKRKNLKIPPDLHEKILRASEITGMTMSGYLEAIVDLSLNKLERSKKSEPSRVK